jgi:membrane fusion protein (multidrug efflux system)
MDRNKKIGIVILVILIVIFSVVAFKWIYYRITHAVSDAVFVEANTFTDVAYRRDSGRIIKLFKKEGDKVLKGEPLAKIDDTDYKLEYKALKYQIKELESEINLYKIQRDRLLVGTGLEAQANLYRTMEATQNMQSIMNKVKALDAKISLVNKDYHRFHKLYKDGVISRHAFEEKETELKNLLNEKNALLNQANAMASLSKAQNLGVAIAQNNQKEAKELTQKIKATENQIKSLEAKLQNVSDMIAETELTSPISGYIVKKFVSVGDIVRPGQPIYAVYDPKSVYVLDIIDETKLHGIKKGCLVHIHIDALPNEHYEGVVSEILRASAAKFALIPRDITAGEFTKVAQRIPVKIKITKGNINLLRVGYSGEVAIDRCANH